MNEAAGAQADIDDVLAPGGQAEGVVEAGDPENLGQGDLQFVGDVFQGGAGQPVEMPVDIQHDGEQIPGLIPVGIDDPGYHGFVGNLGVGGPGPGFGFRQLHFKANGAGFQAGPATGALALVDVAGFLFQGGGEMARLPGNIFQFGKGKELRCWCAGRPRPA